VSVLKTCFNRVYTAAALMAEDITPEESPGDINNSVTVGFETHMNLILDCLG
jgi:hypothetical protein